MVYKKEMLYHRCLFNFSLKFAENQAVLNLSGPLSLWLVLMMVM